MIIFQKGIIHALVFFDAGFCLKLRNYFSRVENIVAKESDERKDQSGFGGLFGGQFFSQIATTRAENLDLINEFHDDSSCLTLDN